MEMINNKRQTLALVIIAAVVIVSLIIGLNFHDNRNGIPMDAVSDNAGGFIALWHKSGGFYCQRIDCGGQAVWQKGGVLVASCAKYGSFDFQADGTGGAILTWSKASTSYYDPTAFYSQRINSEGELVWSDTLISQGGKWITVPDGTGGAIYAWDRFEPVYNALRDSYLCIQKIAPDGERLWGEDGVLLISSSPFHALTEEEKSAGTKGKYTRNHPTYGGDHDIISDGQGGAFVIWQEEGEYGIEYVYAQRFDDTGNPVWNETVMAASAGYYYDSLIPDGSDGFFLGLDADSVYQQHISGNGVLLETKDYITNTISDDSGGTFRVWTVENPTTGPVNKRSLTLYVQRYDIAGNPIWPLKVTILATEKRYKITSVEYIADGSGGLMLTWQFQKEFVIYGGAFAQHLDENGNMLWGENGLAVFNAPDSYQGHSIILSDNTGGAYIIAIAGTGSINGNMVYAQHLDGNGNRLWDNGIRIDK